MGDRANIQMVSNGKSIYIYSHWDGLDGMKQKLREALREGRERWGDPSYLQRYLITSICKTDGLTGYGVSCDRQDNEHNVLRVDIDNQAINLVSSVGWFDGETWEKTANKLKTWTYDEFLKDDVELE